MSTRHCITCPLCEATCGLVVESEGKRVLSIRGDKEDPLSKGYLCPKARALEDLYADSDRLREPVERTNRGWRTISWSEAFDKAVAGIRRVQKRHGKNAMALYLGNPSVHSLGVMSTGQLFLRSLRTRNRYSATSVDQLPHMLASLYMYGNQLAIPVPDVDRTKMLVILGGNPLVSNGSLMTAPDMKRRISAIRDRGGDVVVFDPRRTRTAKHAGEHHFIRPGKDPLLLLALLHTLFDEGLTSLGRLGALCTGLSDLRELSEAYAPESVSEETGVEAAFIRELARRVAAAESAVFYGRFGLCTQEFGGLALWLINALNIVTGNLDRSGGAMFATPAVDLPGMARRLGLLGHHDRYRSRVRDLPEFGGEYPVSTMADEMLEEGEGQVRGLMTIAGNPVLSTPNGPKLERALEGLEFMVSVDPFLNETTRHANLILPPTTPLEREHYDLAFGMFMVRNVAKYSPAVFPRGAKQRHEWEIFRELYARMAGGRGVMGILRREAIRRLPITPRRIVDLGLRTGPHRLSLRKVLAAPHGLDLGPLQPRLPDALETSDKRIQLAPEPFVQDLDRLDASRERPSLQELRLIGRRHLRSNNSWMHNSKRLTKGAHRCTLHLHPDDARQRGLGTGDNALLESSTGSVVVCVEISDNIMPGVVSLPHGWGHSRAGTRLGVASKRPGVSFNDVSDEGRVDVLSGNAVLNDIPVRLSAIDGAP